MRSLYNTIASISYIFYHTAVSTEELVPSTVNSITFIAKGHNYTKLCSENYIRPQKTWAPRPFKCDLDLLALNLRIVRNTTSEGALQFCKNLTEIL